MLVDLNLNSDQTTAYTTGGGWISAPTGKANFVFDAKYTKKSIIPTGSTSYTLLADNLSFASTAYEWLAVSLPNSTAQFKGTGTLNGQGGYSFMVWVKDGAPDTFRIRIWNGAGYRVRQRLQPAIRRRQHRGS